VNIQMLTFICMSVCGHLLTGKWRLVKYVVTGILCVMKAEEVCDVNDSELIYLSIW